MFEKLDQIIEKHKHLEERLSDPVLIKDRKKFETTAREHKELSRVVAAYGEWRSCSEALEEARTLLGDSDPDMRNLAKAEVVEHEPRLEEITLRLRKLMLPKDRNDDKNVIIEIRAGTGGDEAALFATDLYRMYSRYAEIRGWSVEELYRNENNLGGVKEVAALIKGAGAYSQLKFESGTHRVQRVPVTESQGRIHTSAATVAILPEAEAIEANLDENDLRIDVYRSSGPGGQSVNTTDSAVRITHLPTGLVVTCQDEKSQHKNRAKATKILASHLLDLKTREQNEERSAQRKSQIGSGDRSDRIRTYNFPQDRVTDHRLPVTLHDLPGFMNGNIGPLIDSLGAHDEAERMRQDTQESRTTTGSP